ncbi:esterase family protein [Siminovitchia fortis]|uniref:Esterase family protein n=1 Tax=Siminovitchia fortis TaxID=254758 RepID=A0A443IKR9_9BACI|nr:esterase family protein [Siminovitchia fortis]RWR05534.1 esterase family protein [Siminovitchia fortis]WHY83533.1 esterase family protein [Siminovitchia fortis]
MQGTITEIEFDSKELDEKLELLIYLPAAYSPLYKYSLLIVQDGKDYFQMGRLTRFADELLAGEKIENLIIAGIPYKNVKDRRQKYHPDGEKNEAYIRFLAHELVPWLEKRYPTSSVGKCRALMGDSLAATVSLMAAIEYPHTFGKVILHSPYVDDKVLSAVRSHKEPYLLDIYHVIGKDEIEIKFSQERVEDFLTPNRELHQAFEENGFDSFYDEFDGGHSWKYWQPDVKRALAMMFSR